MKTPLVVSRLIPFLLLTAVVLCGVSLFRWQSTANFRAHLDRAEEAVRQHKGQAAEAEWLAARKLDPKNADVSELLGEYYISSGQWARGAEAFRTLGRLDPKRPHVLCRLAACLLRIDDQKDAFATAQEELKRDPNCVPALGLVTALMGMRPSTEQKQLLTYLRRFAHLLPDDSYVLHQFAELLANQYLYDELRPVIAKLLKLNSGDAESYNLLGFADLARADQPDGARSALDDFKRSLRLAPANGGAYYGIGRAYLRLNDPKQAVAALEQAAHLLPAIARIQTELANAYRAAGMPRQAEEVNARALALQRQGSEERRLIVRCIAYPKDPAYPRQLGELYLKLGERNQARYYLGKADQIKPGDPATRGLIARLDGLGSGADFVPRSSPRSQ